MPKVVALLPGGRKHLKQLNTSFQACPSDLVSRHSFWLLLDVRCSLIINRFAMVLLPPFCDGPGPCGGLPQQLPPSPPPPHPQIATPKMVKKFAMQVMGINVQPLLAVGGVSGIAIGFGAQSVSANAITGINLVRCCITWGLRRDVGVGASGMARGVAKGGLVSGINLVCYLAYYNNKHLKLSQTCLTRLLAYSKQSCNPWLRVARPENSVYFV